MTSSKIIKSVIVLCALFLTSCSSFAPRETYTVTNITSEDAEKAARLVSAYRTSKGLSAVSVDERLNKPAIVQVKRIAEMGTLDHSGFMARVANSGITHSAAENLAGGMGNVETAIAEWKTSPGHNENMLRPEFTRIGFARANSTSKHHDYWVLVLGH